MAASPIEAINTVRVLAADMAQNANSGHPGAPMGLAPLAYTLWTKFMKFNPKNPKWIARDRFVLSNGHACALLYSLLHLTGYSQYTMDDLKSFRQLNSKTPGHPEAGLDLSQHAGVEVSTGPLGQGLSNAVGLAIAEAHLRATYNKPDFPVIDNYTWVFCGDGCLMEGITAEASSLAGHLGLGHLIVFYDDNNISIDGSTSLAFTEDVCKRYEAYGWQVMTVQDGNDDLVSLETAIKAAMEDTTRPSFIKVRTTIGIYSSKQGTEKVHGSPLGAEDLANVKKQLGFDPEVSFHVADTVYKAYDRTEKGAEDESKWNALFEQYKAKYPELAAELMRRFDNKYPENWKDALPKYSGEEGGDATRKLSQAALKTLFPVLPELVGGSADLNPSCLTYNNSSHDFQKGHHDGKNIRYGVREHAMAAISNGLAAYGGIIPYASSFLNFLGYCQGAVTLSALSQHHVLYIFTHDSIGLGEDGPTHQPISKTAFVRSTPGISFLRPADGNEVNGAYICALEDREHPSVMALSRQAVPSVPGTSVEGVAKGAYIVQDVSSPKLILVGTGTELHLCVDAAKQLGSDVRVVSMPCWEYFDNQSLEYRKSVFPDGVPVVSVEAATTFGWSKYAHSSIGIDVFGASAPYKHVFEKFGITTFYRFVSTSSLHEKKLKLLQKVSYF